MNTPEQRNETDVDPQEAQRFADKVFGDVEGTMNVWMCILGDRLGLFKDLAANGPCTSSELAARTGILERYAREWLSQMACAGYLAYDPSDQRFAMPPALVPFLAEEGGLHFLGGLYQNFQSIESGLFTKLLRAFREGGGVAYEDYDENFWDGLDRFTNAGFAHRLIEKNIPAIPDALAALEGGALVADVGCGRGRLVQMLAQAFPRARFVGYDSLAANIDRARANLASSGMTDRVQYVCYDAMRALPEPYDLILSFDTVHHATDISRFLRAMCESLKPGGLFVCSEAACAETLEGNLGMGGAILYAGSVMVCVPQVLSESDVAVGAAGLPESRMRELGVQGGFGRIEVVSPQDSDVVFYQMRR